MKKRFYILFTLILPVLLFAQVFTSKKIVTVFELINSDSTAFTYTLSKQAITSAGVYQNNVLIRTLWGNEVTKSGVHTYKWDGLTDEKVAAKGGNYEIRLIANNIKAEWEGAGIGN